MKPKPTGSIKEWLEGKSESELAGIELVGRRYYRDTAKKRAGSNLLEEPVLLRCPGTLETALARIEALDFARKITKDPTVKNFEDARARLGGLLFDEVDAFFYASKCVFRVPEKGETGEPTQWMLPEFMLETVPRGTVYDLITKVLFYAGREDPRDVELDGDTFREAVLAIARERNLSPLAGIDGGARDSFVLTMAALLAPSLTPSSSSPSPEISTPAPSPTKT